MLIMTIIWTDDPSLEGVLNFLHGHVVLCDEVFLVSCLPPETPLFTTFFSKKCDLTGCLWRLNSFTTMSHAAIAMLEALQAHLAIRLESSTHTIHA